MSYLDMYGVVMGKLTGGVYRLSDNRSVCLSFDDGPDERATNAALESLAAMNATAMFFVLADHVAARPQLTRRCIDEGHTIALHGVDHRRMLLLGGATIRAQLREGKSMVEDRTGKAVEYYRPPYGAWNPFMTPVLRELGLVPMFWSKCPGDFDRRLSEETLLRRVDTVTAGDVVVLHDNPNTAARISTVLLRMNNTLMKKNLCAVVPPPLER